MKDWIRWWLAPTYARPEARHEREIVTDRGQLVAERIIRNIPPTRRQLWKPRPARGGKVMGIAYPRDTLAQHHVAPDPKEIM